MKKIIAGILLIGSLTFAGLIIFNVSDSPNPVIQSVSEKITKQNKIESLNEYSTGQKTSQNQINITQEVVKKVAQEVIKNKPNLDGIDPDQLINRVFEEGIANFDIESIRPEVNLFSLNIISDNSEEAVKNYAGNFKKIIAKNAAYSKMENKKATLEDLRLLLISYKKILPELYRLAVPPSAATIHQDGIAVLETQKNILEKLVNADQDPVAAILAMGLISDVNQEIIKFFQDKLDKL